MTASAFPTASYKVSRADLAAQGDAFMEVVRRNLPTTPPGRFDWIYRNSPHGPTTGWSAREETSGALVGVKAVYARRMLVHGRLVMAGVAGDFAVDKEHRAYGPALAIQRATLVESAAQGYAFVYSYPNPLSKPLLRRAGYTTLGRFVRMTKLFRATPYLRKKWNVPLLTSALGRATDVALRLGSRDTYAGVGGFRPETFREFDGRVDALWERARGQSPVIMERTRELLNWRFALCPHGRFDMFGLTDPTDGRLAGYVVSYDEEGMVSVADMFAEDMGPVFDRLLAGFLRHQRSRRKDGVSVIYLGTSRLTERLKRFGFVDRGGDAEAMVYAPDGFSEKGALQNRENWYLFEGDNDI